MIEYIFKTILYKEIYIGMVLLATSEQPTWSVAATEKAFVDSEYFFFKFFCCLIGKLVKYYHFPDKVLGKISLFQTP